MTKELQTGVLRGGVGEDDGNITAMNYNPESEMVTFFYDFYHNSISTMTTYIERINNSTIEITDEEKQKALAEMHTARGLLCYYLFDLYGPIVVAPLEALENPLKDQPLPRMEYNEMINFIEADFQAGVEGLPDPADAEYGRFSTGLARMLLIRLYLHEKKWDKVLAQSDTIINMHHYQLDPDYVGMWGVRAAQNSPEVIWAIPCDYDATSENQWQMMSLPGNYPIQPGYGVIQSSWWFYDSFEENDIRKTNFITAYRSSRAHTRTVSGNSSCSCLRIPQSCECRAKPTSSSHSVLRWPRRWPSRCRRCSGCNWTNIRTKTCVSICATQVFWCCRS